MRISFFILGIALFIGPKVKVVAQGTETVFAPIGASWYYSSSSSGPPWLVDPLYAQFIVERDTFMLGYSAREIGTYVNEGGQMVRIDSLSKFVSTIGDKVYYKVEDEFVLLFDFAAMPGDTIHSKVEDFSLSLGCGSDFNGEVIEFSYVIDSVRTLVIDGQSLRMQGVSSIYQSTETNWVFRGPIIERLGEMGYGGWWWGSGETCIFESGFLRCYSDVDISWRSSSFSDSLPCDFTSSSGEIQFVRYIVYPNPAHHLVTLPPGVEEISLFDMTGRKFEVNFNDSEIEVDPIPSGKYFMRFMLDGVVYVSSFIKQ